MIFSLLIVLISEMAIHIQGAEMTDISTTPSKPTIKTIKRPTKVQQKKDELGEVVGKAIFSSTEGLEDEEGQHSKKDMNNILSLILTEFDGINLEGDTNLGKNKKEEGKSKSEPPKQLEEMDWSAFQSLLLSASSPEETESTTFKKSKSEPIPTSAPEPSTPSTGSTVSFEVGTKTVPQKKSRKNRRN
jgi:hypothetical protein